ncbi:MAG: phosphatidylserine decarboxylase [Lachnospiraceae bacterium]|nr:phosphatidylserine decarboxylase [Lachnospiraceae bacterium]
MKESRAILFLYRTVPGRILLKVLVNPYLSMAASVFLSSKISAFLIPGFVRKNKIDLKQYVVPKGGYRSFNDFFTRRRRSKLCLEPKPELMSPCDGFLTIKKINSDAIFQIKHSSYSIESLLRDKTAADDFAGGMAFIFRLTPAHYHRYVFCADGNIIAKRKIKGVLHCVRPAALERYPVFTENSREYVVIENKKLGKIIQMEVGAMLVGKITNHLTSEPGQMAAGGEEKGYFEYGGSTIIVLAKHRAKLNRAFSGRINSNGEIPVVAGEALYEG